MNYQNEDSEIQNVFIHCPLQRCILVTTSGLEGNCSKHNNHVKGCQKKLK